MKGKVTILIVSILFIVIAGISESIFMEHTFSEFEERVNSLISSDIVDSIEIDDLIDWWNKKLNVMHLFIPHIHLDEITRGLGELQGAVISHDKQTETEILYKLVASSDAIGNMFKIKLGNIF